MFDNDYSEETLKKQLEKLNDQWDGKLLKQELFSAVAITFNIRHGAFAGSFIGPDFITSANWRDCKETQVPIENVWSFYGKFTDFGWTKANGFYTYSLILIR